MELLVLRFSQEASLVNPKDMKNFLVLGPKNGQQEIKIEISKDDMKKIINSIYSSPVTEEDATNSSIDLEDEAALFEKDTTNKLLGIEEDGIESL